MKINTQVTARRLRLAMLSPSIQLAIAKGSQPASLTLERIIKTKLSIAWQAQEKLFIEHGNKIP
ncbi:MAG: hypothetical protein AAF862_11635 [Pseudomonadota bacterium]